MNLLKIIAFISFILNIGFISYILDEKINYQDVSSIQKSKINENEFEIRSEKLINDLLLDSIKRKDKVIEIQDKIIKTYELLYKKS